MKKPKAKKRPVREPGKKELGKRQSKAENERHKEDFNRLLDDAIGIGSGKNDKMS